MEAWGLKAGLGGGVPSCLKDASPQGVVQWLHPDLRSTSEGLPCGSAAEHSADMVVVGGVTRQQWASGPVGCEVSLKRMSCR